MGEEEFLEMLLMKEGRCPLIDLIDYTSWVCGSSFTKGVIEEDNINSDFTKPVPTPAAISLPAPNRKPHHQCLELSAVAETTSVIDAEAMPTPAIGPMVEPTHTIDPEPVTVSILEPELTAVSILKPKPASRSVQSQCR